MDNTNNDTVTINVNEYRRLLTAAANYAMLRDVIAQGVTILYGGSLGLDSAAENVVVRYVLGDDYAATVEALKAREA